MSTMNVIVE